MNRGFLALTLALCSVVGLIVTVEDDNDNAFWWLFLILFVGLAAAAVVFGIMAMRYDRRPFGDRENLGFGCAAVLIGGAICALAILFLYAILFVDLSPSD